MVKAADGFWAEAVKESLRGARRELIEEVMAGLNLKPAVVCTEGNEGNEE